MKRNIYHLGDGEFAAAIAASAFAICSLEENAGSQYQIKTRGPLIRPAETAYQSMLVTEKVQIAKIRKRHDELLSAFLAWENEKKMMAKQQMERRKNQLELGMKRNLQHYKNKLARIDRIIKGAKTQAEDKIRYEESIVKQKANKIRSTGTGPVTCFCF